MPPAGGKGTGPALLESPSDTAPGRLKRRGRESGLGSEDKAPGDLEGQGHRGQGSAQASRCRTGFTTSTGDCELREGRRWVCPVPRRDPRVQKKVGLSKHLLNERKRGPMNGRRKGQGGWPLGALAGVLSEGLAAESARDPCGRGSAMGQAACPNPM